MECWICGKPATTGEHKIKKSLLMEIYGRDNYKKSVLHLKDDKVSSLQGPDSKKVKYQKSLCDHCNHVKTQPFDDAYNKFYKFILSNEDRILVSRMINLAEVYGSEEEHLKTGINNLFKYFAKLFGCDLIESGRKVPRDIKSLLEKDKFTTGLSISFAISEDKLLFRSIKDRGVGIGELNEWKGNFKNFYLRRYQWSIYFSFLHISFWYLVDREIPLGPKWTANSRYLYLGSLFSFSPEQRENLKKHIELDSENSKKNGFDKN